MNFLIPFIPYFAAFLGTFARVMVPYWTKKAETGNLSWNTAEALPPFLGGALAFLGLLAGGLLEAATWQQALGYGLVATVSSAGTGDLLKMGKRIYSLLTNNSEDGS